LQLSRENSLFECDNAVCPSYPSRKGKCDNAVCPSYLPCKSTEFFLFKGDNIGFSVCPFCKGRYDSAVCPSYPSRKGKCDNAACPLYPPFKARFFLFGAIRGVSSLRHVRLLREWSLLFSCDSVCAVHNSEKFLLFLPV
jgi:hypothetical protein